MAVSNVIERLGRAIFEAPFGNHKISKDAPELAEIRIMVLDAVKARSHRASGKSVFPYNLVRVNLLGVPEEQAAVFHSGFLATYFAEEVLASLTRSNFRFPQDLRVEISTRPGLPGPGQGWLSVDTEMLEAAKVEESQTPSQPATLIVATGAASPMELLLNKPRINIGRTADVHRSAGPSRRNDLVFAEHDEVSRSVSREHAHIIRSPKTDEYRLFNDRVYKGNENCGIWIVRDGLSQPVHRGVRGTVLQSGDEIHLGNAVIRFQ